MEDDADDQLADILRHLAACEARVGAPLPVAGDDDGDGGTPASVTPSAHQERDSTSDPLRDLRFKIKVRQFLSTSSPVRRLPLDDEPPGRLHRAFGGRGGAASPTAARQSLAHAAAVSSSPERTRHASPSNALLVEPLCATEAVHRAKLGQQEVEDRMSLGSRFSIAVSRMSTTLVARHQRHVNEERKLLAHYTGELAAHSEAHQQFERQAAIAEAQAAALHVAHQRRATVVEDRQLYKATERIVANEVRRRTESALIARAKADQARAERHQADMQHRIDRLLVSQEAYFDSNDVRSPVNRRRFELLSLTPQPVSRATIAAANRPDIASTERVMQRRLVDATRIVNVAQRRQREAEDRAAAEKAAAERAMQLQRAAADHAMEKVHRALHASVTTLRRQSGTSTTRAVSPDGAVPASPSRLEHAMAASALVVHRAKVLGEDLSRKQQARRDLVDAVIAVESERLAEERALRCRRWGELLDDGSVPCCLPPAVSSVTALPNSAQRQRVLATLHDLMERAAGVAVCGLSLEALRQLRDLVVRAIDHVGDARAQHAEDDFASFTLNLSQPPWADCAFIPGLNARFHPTGDVDSWRLRPGVARQKWSHERAWATLADVCAIVPNIRIVDLGDVARHFQTRSRSSVSVLDRRHVRHALAKVAVQLTLLAPTVTEVRGCLMDWGDDDDGDNGANDADGVGWERLLRQQLTSNLSYVKHVERLQRTLAARLALASVERMEADQLPMIRKRAHAAFLGHAEHIEFAEMSARRLLSHVADACFSMVLQRAAESESEATWLDEAAGRWLQAKQDLMAEEEQGRAAIARVGGGRGADLLRAWMDTLHEIRRREALHATALQAQRRALEDDEVAARRQLRQDTLTRRHEWADLFRQEQRPILDLEAERQRVIDTERDRLARIEKARLAALERERLDAIRDRERRELETQRQARERFQLDGQEGARRDVIAQEESASRKGALAAAVKTAQAAYKRMCDRRTRYEMRLRVAALPLHIECVDSVAGGHSEPSSSSATSARQFVAGSDAAEPLLSTGRLIVNISKQPQYMGQETATHDAEPVVRAGSPDAASTGRLRREKKNNDVIGPPDADEVTTETWLSDKRTVLSAKVTVAVEDGRDIDAALDVADLYHTLDVDLTALPEPGGAAEEEKMMWPLRRHRARLWRTHPSARREVVCEGLVICCGAAALKDVSVLRVRRCELNVISGDVVVTVNEVLRSLGTRPLPRHDGQVASLEGCVTRVAVSLRSASPGEAAYDGGFLPAVARDETVESVFAWTAMWRDAEVSQATAMSSSAWRARTVSRSSRRGHVGGARPVVCVPGDGPVALQLLQPLPWISGASIGGDARSDPAVPPAVRASPVVVVDLGPPPLGGGASAEIGFSLTSFFGYAIADAKPPPLRRRSIRRNSIRRLSSGLPSVPPSEPSVPRTVNVVASPPKNGAELLSGLAPGTVVAAVLLEPNASSGVYPDTVEETQGLVRLPEFLHGMPPAAGPEGEQTAASASTFLPSHRRALFVMSPTVDVATVIALWQNVAVAFRASAAVASAAAGDDGDEPETTCRARVECIFPGHQARYVRDIELRIVPPTATAVPATTSPLIALNVGRCVPFFLTREAARSRAMLTKLAVAAVGRPPRARLPYADRLEPLPPLPLMLMPNATVAPSFTAALSDDHPDDERARREGAADGDAFEAEDASCFLSVRVVADSEAGPARMHAAFPTAREVLQVASDVTSVRLNDSHVAALFRWTALDVVPPSSDRSLAVTGAKGNTTSKGGRVDPKAAQAAPPPVSCALQCAGDTLLLHVLNRGGDGEGATSRHSIPAFIPIGRVVRKSRTWLLLYVTPFAAHCSVVIEAMLRSVTYGCTAGPEELPPTPSTALATRCANRRVEVVATGWASIATRLTFVVSVQSPLLQVDVGDPSGFPPSDDGRPPQDVRAAGLSMSRRFPGLLNYVLMTLDGNAASGSGEGGCLRLEQPVWSASELEDAWDGGYIRVVGSRGWTGPSDGPSGGDRIIFYDDDASGQLRLFPAPGPNPPSWLAVRSGAGSVPFPAKLNQSLRTEFDLWMRGGSSPTVGVSAAELEPVAWAHAAAKADVRFIAFGHEVIGCVGPLPGGGLALHFFGRGANVAALDDGCDRASRCSVRRDMVSAALSRLGAVLLSIAQPRQKGKKTLAKGAGTVDSVAAAADCRRVVTVACSSGRYLHCHRDRLVIDCQQAGRDALLPWNVSLRSDSSAIRIRIARNSDDGGQDGVLPSPGTTHLNERDATFLFAGSSPAHVDVVPREPSTAIHRDVVGVELRIELRAGVKMEDVRAFIHSADVRLAASSPPPGGDVAALGAHTSGALILVPPVADDGWSFSALHVAGEIVGRAAIGWSDPLGSANEPASGADEAPAGTIPTGGGSAQQRVTVIRCIIDQAAFLAKAASEQAAMLEQIVESVVVWISPAAGAVPPRASKKAPSLPQVTAEGALDVTVSLWVMVRDVALARAFQQRTSLRVFPPIFQLAEGMKYIAVGNNDPRIPLVPRINVALQQQDCGGTVDPSGAPRLPRGSSVRVTMGNRRATGGPSVLITVDWKATGFVWHSLTGTLLSAATSPLGGSPSPAAIAHCEGLTPASWEFHQRAVAHVDIYPTSLILTVAPRCCGLTAAQLQALLRGIHVSRTSTSTPLPADSDAAVIVRLDMAIPAAPAPGTDNEDGDDAASGLVDIATQECAELRVELLDTAPPFVVGKAVIAELVAAGCPPPSDEGSIVYVMRHTGGVPLLPDATLTNLGEDSASSSRTVKGALFGPSTENATDSQSVPSTHGSRLVLTVVSGSEAADELSIASASSMCQPDEALLTYVTDDAGRRLARVTGAPGARHQLSVDILCDILPNELTQLVLRQLVLAVGECRASPTTTFTTSSSGGRHSNGHAVWALSPAMHITKRLVAIRLWSKRCGAASPARSLLHVAVLPPLVARVAAAITWSVVNGTDVECAPFEEACVPSLAPAAGGPAPYFNGAADAQLRVTIRYIGSSPSSQPAFAVRFDGAANQVVHKFPHGDILVGVKKVASCEVIAPSPSSDVAASTVIVTWQKDRAGNPIHTFVEAVLRSVRIQWVGAVPDRRGPVGSVEGEGQQLGKEEGVDDSMTCFLQCDVTDQGGGVGAPTKGPLAFGIRVRRPPRGNPRRPSEAPS